jgi:hypothetical protein
VIFVVAEIKVCCMLFARNKRYGHNKMHLKKWRENHQDARADGRRSIPRETCIIAQMTCGEGNDLTPCLMHPRRISQQK